MGFQTSSTSFFFVWCWCILPIYIRAVVQISLDQIQTDSCGDYEYFDSTNLVCQSCSDGCTDGIGDNCNKVPDETSLGPNGNALWCKCETGYLKEQQWLTLYDDGDGDWPGGQNTGFICTRAYDVSTDDAATPIHRDTALHDGSAAVTCDMTTDGLSTTSGDCTCGSAPSADSSSFTLDVLVEGDAAGNYEVSGNKSCVTCPSGTAVVSTAGTYGGVYYNVDLYSCQSCPGPEMDMSDRCSTCSSGYVPTPYGVSGMGPLTCIYSTHATYIENTYNSGDTGYEMTYRQVQTAINEDANTEVIVSGSLAMKHFFVNASAKCYFYKGPESIANCQCLANLCALHLFDPTSAPCSAFHDIEEARGSGAYDQAGWQSALPWLKYDESAAVVRGDRSIDMTLGLNVAAVRAGNVDASELTFYFGVTSLNGTWLGLQEVDTQFFYCASGAPRTNQGGGTSRSTNWLRYGNSFREKFRCDLEGLIDREPLFYEPWVYDVSSEMLSPVPVLILDYVNELDAKVNINLNAEEETDDVFVRRFALFDAMSGLNNNGYTDSPQVIRYVKKMHLKISSLPSDASRIKAPILELTYAAREPRGGLWKKDLRFDTIEFLVEYSMERTDYDDTLYGFFTFICISSGIAAFLRWQNWSFRNIRLASTSRRRRDDDDDENEPVLGSGANGTSMDLAMRGRTLASIQQFLRSQQWAGVVILAHSWALFNFALLWSLCTTYFVFFKMQSETEAAYILLPPHTHYEDEGDNYFFLETLLYTMTFNQSVFLLYQIYLQCSSEVFFVDMETGAGLLPISSSSSAEAPPPKSSRGGASGWRRILIANEWTKLCGTRRTSIEFTLFWMAFVLVGNDLEYLSTPQPNINNHDSLSCGANEAPNFLLRFANITWWFALLEIAQLGTQHIRRYLACIGLETEPLGQQLVDLCTTAKISIVSVVDLYHGYVLFCDSSADSADTSMRDLTQHLLMEMKGDRHAARRGPSHLADRPGFEDIQAFELYVSDGWLRWFKQLQLKLESVARKYPGGGGGGSGGNTSWNDMPGGRARNRRQGGNTSIFKQSLEDRQRVLLIGGMEVLNDKLLKFLKRQYTSDLEWEAVTHVEGQFHWLWDSLRTVPPEIKDLRTENALVPDKNHRFTSCGLYGIEFELWLRDVLTFATADLWFQDTTTSIFFTYATYQLIRYSRVYFGAISLSQSSLIDKTFLFSNS